MVRMAQYLWLMLGHAALVLGVIGIFLPVMPTVPFLLLASICYGRGSKKFEAWLLQHPRLGPPVVEWRQYRSIRLNFKIIAITSIICSMILTWFVPGMPRLGAWGVTSLLVLAVIFIATRPSTQR